MSASTINVWWNGAVIAAVKPTDYEIHTFVQDVTAKAGENKLSFVSSGDITGGGLSVDNVRLVRQITEDVIVNGGFELGQNVGDSWAMFKTLPGWKSDGAGI